MPLMGYGNIFFYIFIFLKQNLQQDFSLCGKKIKGYSTYTKGKHIPIMLDNIPYQAYQHKKGNTPNIMGNHKPILSH